MKNKLINLRVTGLKDTELILIKKRMITILYNNNEYIIGDYVINEAPIYSKPSRGPRELIRKKKLERINMYMLGK